MSNAATNATLPALRPELQVLPGIREVNGLRTWLIFDPLRHQYYQIDHKSRSILSQWSLGNAADIIEKLQFKEITQEDIKSLLLFLWANSLTISPPNDENTFYSEHRSNKTVHWFTRLLHGYISFFVPLLRPEIFLKRTEPFFRIFFARAWLFFIVFIALIGIYLTSRQWDQFVHTFMHFFSLQGLLYYAFALVFVKVAHELGHAYAATRYGCRVKSIGVAFIVMLPILYTDTTDSWKLTSRKQRLIICGAGVIVELSIAAIATFVWALSADGPLRSTAFFIATTSWIMSILVNTNPLMRFDGYHFLSDLLGIQNLQSRSFAFGRWSMRKKLFGIHDPAPEAMESKWAKGLTLFAWATWTYRFFLFLGIAAIVHQMFPRPFGTFLAVVEIGFFIVIPIMNEMKEWYKQAWVIIKNPSSWLTFSLLSCLIVALVYPWHSTIRIPAVLEPAVVMDLHSPEPARVVDVSVELGDQVTEGQTLFLLSSEQIDNRVERIQRKIDLTKAMLNRIAADDYDLEQNIVLKSELESYQEEYAGLQTQREQLSVRAPFSGRVSNLAGDIHIDRWVAEGEHLITINSSAGAKVRGFVERSNVGRISSGTDVVFVPEIPELPKLKGSVDLVEAANAEVLNIPALASYYGGKIAVNKKESQFEPLKSWYHISIQADDYHRPIEQQRRGTVLAKGDPESLAKRIWRRMFHVALREVFI